MATVFSRWGGNAENKKGVLHQAGKSRSDCRPGIFPHSDWRIALELALTSCLMAMTTIAANPPWDYLPATGPAPLRFRPPKTTSSVRLLPPLFMGDPASVPVPLENTNASPNKMNSVGNQSQPRSSATASVVSHSPLAPTNSVPLLPTGQSALATNANLTLISLNETNPAPMVTPQMLVPFFRSPATNNPPATVVLPAFVPPTSVNPPSSSAVYKTQ